MTCIEWKIRRKTVTSCWQYVGLVIFVYRDRRSYTIPHQEKLEKAEECEEW